MIDEETFVERLRSLSRLRNAEVVQSELESVRAEDIAEGLIRLESEESLNILLQLDEETAADVLVELPAESAKRLVSELPDTTLALYLDILPMDDALELRDHIPADRFEALLEVIPREDAQEIRRLMSYPEGSAGQLMTEDFFAVAPNSSMRQIIRLIRTSDEDEYETVNDIYVMDEHKHLLGVFSLRQAVRSPLLALAKDVMEPEVVSCRFDTPAEEVARQIARYGFYAMPVLDARGRLLGIFTVDDAQAVLQEAESEDVLKMGGVSGDADAYLSLSVGQLVKRRVPWLLALFIAESLTGSVLRHYGQGDDNTVKLAPLTFFIPLLIGAGGNSGSQVTTTITRALALGEVRTGDWWRVFRRELVTALISGTILGVVGFLRAWLPVPIIGWNSPLDLSLVVALTLPAIVAWAATVGSLLPIGAKRIGVDPAVMSAPFITTFVDATGLVIYFEIAHHILSKAT